jgi:replicative DNA helicase
VASRAAEDLDPNGRVRTLPGPAAAGSRGFERVPPHNLDAEVSVLGSMLLSRDAIAEVSELVGPQDFYRGAHRTMFEAARNLYDRGEPVDPVTLADELEGRGTLADVGGVVGIDEIVRRVPVAANGLYYARIVADQALRRRLIEAGTQIAGLGYEPERGVAEAVDTAEQVIYGVAQRGNMGDFVSMKQLVTASFELIEKLHENNSSITGLATGFKDFDLLTAGLQPSNLVIIAARPAMGKSTLVTNLATHVAVESRQPVVMFSLEMSQMELVQRILAAEARIPSDRLRTGRLEEPDWPKLSQAMGRLAEAPLYIDDTPGINLMEIRSKCRRLKQKHGLSLVIIDYLQLMQSHRRIENRVQEVSELSRGLKILAKELDLPVIALSQLSRKPEDRARDDRRPQLADLRESGSIEQDADLVAFIYRDEVYDPESAHKGEAELIVSKHRNGRLDTVRLSFIGQHSRFVNMARGPIGGRGGPL